MHCVERVGVVGRLKKTVSWSKVEIFADSTRVISVLGPPGKAMPRVLPCVHICNMC